MSYTPTQDQAFLADTHALMLTLAGTAGIVAARVIKRDRSIMESDDLKQPVIICYGGNFRPATNPGFPSDGQEGTYSVIVQASFPVDSKASWQARWEAFKVAIQGALTDPLTLQTGRRLNKQVRWGAEPPVWLAKPDGILTIDTFYTVQMEVY